MIRGVAFVILVVGCFIMFAVWIHGVLNSDGRCDPDEDCENCPFPCENHERKRRDRK